MSQQKKETVLIMAGGTGGHVFPALAAARRFQRLGYAIEWLGTARGIEADIVPNAGIPLNTITVTGLRGKGLKTRLLAPFKLLYAFLQVIRLLLRVKPKVVLGMGGYVTGPGGIAAWLLRCPLVIHEQNAIPGLTNQLLSRFSTRVLEGFPNTFSFKRNVTCTGNPVREDILNLNLLSSRFDERSGPLHLLVLGGSLGAKRINEVVPEALSLIPAEKRPEVWHQTGNTTLDATCHAYGTLGIDAKSIVPFIDNMAEALKWADIVVCRAGALTVAELSAVGVGSLLVPYPHAVDDHQTRNAQYLVDAGAAQLLPQHTLTPPKLSEILTSLINEPQRYRDMAEASKQLAYLDATKDVVSHCLEVKKHA